MRSLAPNMASPSDEKLMASVRRGDSAALTPLFERHSRRLFGFLRGLVGSASLAEDLVQETFLRILAHRRTYRAGKPFVPWLLSIARNAAWAQLGKQARMPVAELPELPQAGGQETRQLERERAERLARALQALSAKEREVLLLSYFDGMRHREIASVVGSTPGAVKVRIHRARETLRRQLAARENRP